MAAAQLNQARFVLRGIVFLSALWIYVLWQFELPIHSPVALAAIFLLHVIIFVDPYTYRVMPTCWRLFTSHLRCCFTR